jgi:hypothetical protein
MIVADVWRRTYGCVSILFISTPVHKFVCQQLLMNDEARTNSRWPNGRSQFAAVLQILVRVPLPPINITAPTGTMSDPTATNVEPRPTDPLPRRRGSALSALKTKKLSKGSRTTG